MKKLLSLIIVLILSFSFVACAPTTTSEKGEENKISIAIEEDLSTLNAIKSFGVEWFNMSRFYQEWLKNFSGKEIMTFIVSQEIDCFYAYYFSSEHIITDKSNKIVGTMGEGYIDGYTFLSDKDAMLYPTIVVRYNSVDEILQTIQTADGKEYTIDLCLAQKSVNQLIDVDLGETIKENLNVYVRYPLKIEDGKISAITDYSICEEYKNDKELLDLAGEYATVKPDVILTDMFIGDLINDDYFFKVISSGENEWLYRYAYSLLGAEEAKEIFLSDRSNFTDEEKAMLSNVFVDIDEYGTVLDFTLIKSLLK